MYQLISDVHENEQIKKSFNELTKKVFCFSFEDWDNRGLWTTNFKPYVIVDGERVISNVSVNFMTFFVDGEKKHYIQLGTVMTDPDYRNQGLGRRILEHILSEYKDKVDGIYLFGNDSVLDYYPRFGFTVGTEYEYYQEINSSKALMLAEKVDMSKIENVNQVLDAFQLRTVNERLALIDNRGIAGFYATQLMSENYYYLKEENAFVIAEIEEDTLRLHLVIADHVVDLNRVIYSFGNTIREVVFHFTPLNCNQFSERIHKEEDCTYFYLGEDLKRITKGKLMFPTISHT